MPNGSAQDVTDPVHSGRRLFLGVLFATLHVLSAVVYLDFPGTDARGILPVIDSRALAVP